VLRGSSGAVITVCGDDVTKRRLGDDGRIGEQGRWLQRNESPVLPRVHRVYTESYVMERLATPPVRLLDHGAVLFEVVNQLSEHVWSRPAVVPINHEMLRLKIERLLRDFNLDALWTWISQTYGRINWSGLHPCLTHGDPTFDNVMIRDATGELVIIDPIPASLVNPDLRCVDVGKILQSALGWEAARYATSDFTLNVTPNQVLSVLDATHGYTRNEWEASVLWSVIHFLRLLPYVDDTVRREVRRLISDATTLL
jgi:hypothetical protein